MPGMTHLLSFGFSHHRAPLELRERVAIAPDRVGPALKGLLALPGVQEASVLSTCNRTELFLAVDDPDTRAPLAWFEQLHRDRREALEQHAARFRDGVAARHMFRVAAGLDSMIVGEPQILGQVKQAYELARDHGSLGKLLNRAFQQSFLVAKKVRTDTAIGAQPVSVAFAAVSLARQIFGDLQGRTALLIGAGQTVALAARHLAAAGARELIVANRSRGRAEQLVAEVGGEVISMGLIPEALARADIAISSTGSELPVLGKGAVERAIRRRRRPIFMVDLAVPRDIEPEVEELSDVYLYTVDDLRNVIQDNLSSRQAAAQEAERIVEEQVGSFEEWCNAQAAVPLVQSLRSSLGRQRDLALEQALAEMRRGQDPEQVLRRLAHDLTAKFAHGPSVAIRRSAARADGQTLDTLRRVLGLDED